MWITLAQRNRNIFASCIAFLRCFAAKILKKAFLFQIVSNVLFSFLNVKRSRTFTKSSK